MQTPHEIVNVLLEDGEVDIDPRELIDQAIWFARPNEFKFVKYVEPGPPDFEGMPVSEYEPTYFKVYWKGHIDKTTGKDVLLGEILVEHDEHGTPIWSIVDVPQSSGQHLHDNTENAFHSRFDAARDLLTIYKQFMAEQHAQ